MSLSMVNLVYRRCPDWRRSIRSRVRIANYIAIQLQFERFKSEFDANKNSKFQFSGANRANGVEVGFFCESIRVNRPDSRS